MHHLLIGYGYCAYYLARLLTQEKQAVTAVARHNKLVLPSPYFNTLCQDISEPFLWQEGQTCLYYFAPPPSTGASDTLLASFIARAQLNIVKVVYVSSTGVYGDHQGQWIDEQAPCHIENDRQRRRLDAEQQWQMFCEQKQIPCLILRLAGIYGPERLPIEAARLGSPLIDPQQAPFSNHIYVEDLAKITMGLAKQSHGLFNIADGQPQKMGTLQRLTAEQLNLPPAPYASFEEIWQAASPMKREFMGASKQLRIEKLQATLKTILQLTPLTAGVQRSLLNTKPEDKR